MKFITILKEFITFFLQDKLSILTVSGVFKEPAESLLAAERMLGFSRTFVLKAGPNREYKILNDMLLVTNVTSSRQRCAFKLNKVPRSNYVSLPAARTEKEMIEMAEAFQQITNLTLYWSKRFVHTIKYFTINMGISPKSYT